MFQRPARPLPSAVSPHLRTWLAAPSSITPPLSTEVDEVIALRGDQLVIASDFQRAITALLTDLGHDSTSGTSGP